MKTRLRSLLLAGAALAASLLFSTTPARAAIDLNENGVSDIWEFVLHPGSTNPEADDDGDGQNNRAEAIFGTDPKTGGDYFRPPTLAYDAATGQLVVSWPTRPGKRYQLQTCPDLAAGNWTNDGAAVVGNGSTVSVNRTPGSLAKNYLRVQVSDVDTDGDRMLDWEEIVIGLNPNIADNPADESEGEEPSAPPPPPDPNIVTILATNAFAYEDGPAQGQVTIHRTGGTNQVIVGYTVTGTATINSDHTTVSGWINLAPNVNSATINVLPLVDAILESSESVTVTLSYVLSYGPSGPLSIAPGNPKKATVVIANLATATGTGLLGQYYDTSSTTYSNAANFNAAQLKVTRVDPTVDFDWLQGTPNANTALASTDDYSVRWEGYITPTTAGSYVFQIDADARARVFFDADGAGAGGLVQILENGWDTAATGGFKQSASFPLIVPPTAGDRYFMRVEFVETTGNATCRFQWNRDGGTFANIPSTNVFTTNTGSIAGWVGTYYDGNNFNTLVATQTDTAITNGNNGIWGAGTPNVVSDPPNNLLPVHRDTFSVRWTGQVQPQYAEEYTFVVNCEDAAKLWINGQPLTLKVATTTNTAGTYSYNGTSGDCVVTHPNIPNGSFVVGESARIEPTSGNLNYATGSAYSYDGATGLTVVTYSNVTTVAPGGFLVGETVFLDPTTGNLSTLASLPYVISAADSTTFTVNFGTGTFTTGTGVLSIADVRDALITAVGTGTITVNFGTGKSATGTGNCNIDWINKPIDWNSASNITADRYARVSMLAGVRYDIRLDYFENTSTAKCQLSWYSPSQPKQIIPSSRLYPASVPQQQASHTTPASAFAQVGGPFSLTVAGSNGAAVSISGKPTWLTFSGGVLSGTPPAGSGGEYQMVITTTSAAGVGTSVINLHVEDNTATPVAREFWNGVSGSTVADIPTGTTPTGTESLATLQGPTGAGPDYGARIRGYISAPATGNYYFWIASNNASELWISNDDDPINTIKRAYVTTGSATPQTWSAETNQKSAWLALEAGSRYYFEVLHKAGSGTGDNLAVGWAKPGQSGSAPSQVVPGHALVTYTPAAPGSSSGTLYLATVLSQAGAVTTGVGTATLRVFEDANPQYALIQFNFSGLTGIRTTHHIHADAFLTGSQGEIVFDFDQPETSGGELLSETNEVDGNGKGYGSGSFKWTFEDMQGSFTKAQMIEMIRQGKAYLNLHTAMYPAGEIRGNFTFAAGSRTFTPPTAPPSWTDDHNTDAGAARFLTQATFGPNIADIAALKAMASYEAWIDAQFALSTSLTGHQLPEVQARELSDAGGGAIFNETLTFNAWWRMAVGGADQLRQRVAFALSEIHVVSAQGPLDNRADALSHFYDQLADNAFGNFRDILETTTLTPAMGRYLDMLRNDKPDQSVGRIPNENYAREIKQLFSIGLFRMWPDGTLVLSQNDTPVETYTQREIVGLAHVFTGWDYGYDGAFRTSIGAATSWTRLMREVPARHFTGPKRILNNEVLPGITTTVGTVVDPYANHNATQFNDAAYQALPALELDAVHDQLFNHPNLGPFICRQLIQRLVMSNPPRDYLYRVVQKFEDHGDVGQYGAVKRGNMKAVIKAILLDYEARSTGAGSAAVKSTFGKQREAVLRIAAAARAFRQANSTGSWDQGVDGSVGGHVIRVTASNKFAGGNTAFLEFTPGGAWVPGDTTPSSEAYTVLSTPAPTSSVFYVNAKGWAGVSTSNGSSTGGISSTYSAPNSSTIRVLLSSHWLPVGGKAYLDFELPSGTPIPDGVYTVTNIESAGAGGAYFEFALASATGRSGRVRMVRFTGSFTVSSSGLVAPQERRITLDTTSGGIADHHMVSPNPIFLNFTVGNPIPLDAEFTVENVPDSNTFTVLTNLAGVGGANDSDNGMWMFPLVSQPMSRSGTLTALASTYNMGSTDADIDQTPLNSPTVFNFFLPDFKFPGTLASQGITTPEFQDTAETNVIRADNFIFNGIFNPGNTNGISSFKTGTNALVLDLTPWMANATDLGLGAGPQTGQAWTSNANLPTLVNQLNMLLIAGQMPANRRTIIENFLTYERTIVSIDNGSNPCRINVSAAHNLATGDYVTLSGITAGTFQLISDSSAVTINATWKITVVDSDTFTLDLVKLIGTDTLSSARVSYVPYTNSAPSDTNKRDRLRSILHLILTSPDYTIQR